MRFELVNEFCVHYIMKNLILQISESILHSLIQLLLVGFDLSLTVLNRILKKDKNIVGNKSLNKTAMPKLSNMNNLTDNIHLYFFIRYK